MALNRQELPETEALTTSGGENSAKTVSIETNSPASGFSIDEGEVARFSALAAKWWDVKGEFAPLHRFNPTRVRFIRDTCLMHFSHLSSARPGVGDRSPPPRSQERSELGVSDIELGDDVHPFGHMRLLDVGCGGGLLSEPMRRMGFEVTGLDASEKNIGTARAHAAQGNLDIRYLAQTVEQLAAAGEPQFDVVLCMEVIEHVADPREFLKTCASLVKPGGLMFVATLNRTTKAFALGIVAAEYVLRWVPQGTHDWNKFLKPSEIESFLSETALTTDPAVGVSYNPLLDQWALSNDTAVNYMMVARAF
ncbi:bifunctional 2-polyprenyl-6-hydroxyphenol methylase/3-demethylubiquinol 3-O-methyltransferase UbiG [Asticcacaulis machinosus]|uniref:Ubiquinone biosynthesis O-methyltransferase n=1 Tax=Asticcacaulis machinosus TaxID=2984211 RepID=A0ABT5HIB9_9CAUL|nr:bifunctional 2-polyprenyl-6-hydroxyphenol methylase/3-demethylubiquinol 3-O-methyltransferase UbiG [Asticcacaulis machinosus]MDC7675988.1 bifunctional 2-polyprenyl-6-hydroxyphenol methylase/3-demethylubiquinol 3-O-methyltransferase UbiG [Asticcacaulis machinosus]